MGTRKQVTIAALVAGVTLSWLSGCDSTASKPFRVSDSVTEYCAMKPTVMMCEEFAPRLAEFLAESRDAEWAAPLERLIAKSMPANGQPRFEIRALECRRTRCAFEYAVAADDLGQTWAGYTELDRHLELIGGVTAPELPSGSGNGMWVSVMIWRKRS